MNTLMKQMCVTFGAVMLSTAVWAKLPVPPETPESKAAKEAAAAKTAAGAKMDGYKLCVAQEAAAAAYFKSAKAKGKTVAPGEGPACVKPS